MNKIFLTSIFLLILSVFANAQDVPPSYGFVEVVDYKNEPVSDASVRLINRGDYTDSQTGQAAVKTDEKGLTEKGIMIRHSDFDIPFSISKPGYYTFIDCFGLFNFKKGWWRDNKENLLRIELLKIPENGAERKAIGNEQQKREFFLAAVKSDVEAVRRFLKADLSPNLTTSDLRGLPAKRDVPIIYFALSFSDKLSPSKPQVLKLFLDAGADVRSKFTRSILADYLQTDFYKPGFYSTEILGEKLKTEVEAVVDLLIKAGADLNAPSSIDGNPPIIAAAENGYVWIVKKLLDKGVSANAKDERGYTALILLAASPYTPLHPSGVETFKLLLASKADPNVVVNNVNGLDDVCETALMDAAGNGSVEFVKLLLANRANAKFTCKNGRDALIAALGNESAQPELERKKVEAAKVLIEAGANLNAVGEHGATALMIAAWRGDTELVKMMLGRGAPVNAADKYDRTPLMYAIFFPYQPRIETIETLLSAGADVNVLTKSYNQYNRCQTALMQAAAKGNGEIIRALLQHRADPNLTCKDGDAPIVYAAGSGRVEAIKILLNAGADAKGEQGRRALNALKYVAEHPQYYDLNTAEDIRKLLEAAGAK